jgi:plasmid maintenance system antidote protein VapI
MAAPTEPAKVREVRALRERHVSIRMIAALTGVSKSTVGEIVRGEGEPIAEQCCERCGVEFIALGSSVGRKRFCRERDCLRARWRERRAAA